MRLDPAILGAAACVAGAVLLACQKDPPPPADSIGAPSVPPAPARPPAAPPLARQPAPEGNSFSVVGVAEGDVLNMRSAPDASSALVGSIPPGTAHVTGVGTPTQVEQTIWQRVRYRGTEGWVNTRFLKSNAGAPTDPASVAGANTRLLEPLICFGNEPFWAVQFKADGSATCEAMCEGPPGLRVVNVSLAPSGEPQGFDLLDAQGGLFLRAVMRKTGTCSDGMSDNVHPFVFTGTGKPGPLEGCCRDKRVKLPFG
jgi:uncharacterized membrane protein